MRYLILGASGMAGHMICAYLSSRGYDVTGVSRRPMQKNFVASHIQGDLCDHSFYEEVMQGLSEYDVVINAVGILNKHCDQEPDRAVLVNSWIPQRISAHLSQANTYFIHLSTDCVFAGNTGPYTESTFPDGEGLYDRTKALGEARGENTLVLRQSIIGPDLYSNGEGLLNWFLQAPEKIHGYKNAIWTGLTTLELSKAIEACSQEKPTGLVNMVPKGNGLSKYEILTHFNSLLRNNSVIIEPTELPILDKSLTRTNWAPKYQPKPYHSQFEELSEWIVSHSYLYPHYSL